MRKRIFVVTGGNQGEGLAIVKELLSKKNMMFVSLTKIYTTYNKSSQRS